VCSLDLYRQQLYAGVNQNSQKVVPVVYYNLILFFVYIEKNADYVRKDNYNSTLD